MGRVLRRTLQTLQSAAVSLSLLCAGATPAAAGPRPVEPRFAPPSSTPIPTDPSVETELRWMLNGAGVVLLLGALALAAVLWRRSHSTARRIATP
jgi:hypothetical protein